MKNPERWLHTGGFIYHGPSSYLCECQAVFVTAWPCFMCKFQRHHCQEFKLTRLKNSKHAANAATSLVQTRHCGDIAAHAIGDVLVPPSAIHIMDGLPPKDTGKPELSGDWQNHQDPSVVGQGLFHLIENLGPWRSEIVTDCHLTLTD